MPEDKRYNGWTNYETWAVKLWLDNDEPSYRMQGEWAKDAKDSAENDRTYPGQSWRERTLCILCDTIKDFIEENNPLNDSATMYSDLLSAAISEVNWYEIAENIIDDSEIEFNESTEEEMSE